ncbi:MAG TPA: VWA domain-containing protein [Blastocatellia bacterium]|nr:VWA domain-containing protein [Blastocatellia bacterium]
MIKISRAIILSSTALILFIASAVGALSQQSSRDGEQDDDVKLSSTLVQVPTVVTDRAGRFITDLAKNEFVVFEDGKRQEVSIFTAIKQPFNAVLVLDTSNSAEDRLHAIQNVAAGFARETGSDDRMMVISFDNEVRQLTDFTSDRQELEAAIKSTEAGFGKLLYEAVVRALEQLREREGRRAVILLTDGVDMRSIEATAESTLRLAEETGAVVYIVRFDTRWWIESEARRQKAAEPQSKVPFSIDGRIPLPPDFGGPDPTPTGFPKVRAPRIEVGPRAGPRVTVIDGPNAKPRTINEPPPDEITANLDKLYGEADKFLQTITTRTAGRLFQAETFDDTRSAFAAIADELRNLYMIGYYPATERRDGKYRKIKVEVARKEVQVRARPGYRSPKEQ